MDKESILQLSKDHKFIKERKEMKKVKILEHIALMLMMAGKVVDQKVESQTKVVREKIITKLELT